MIYCTCVEWYCSTWYYFILHIHFISYWYSCLLQRCPPFFGALTLSSCGLGIGWSASVVGILCRHLSSDQKRRDGFDPILNQDLQTILPCGLQIDRINRGSDAEDKMQFVEELRSAWKTFMIGRTSYIDQQFLYHLYCHYCCTHCFEMFWASLTRQFRSSLCEWTPWRLPGCRLRYAMLGQAGLCYASKSQ